MDSNKHMISKSDSRRGGGSKNAQEDNDLANKFHERGEIADAGRPSTSAESRIKFLTPIQ